MADGTSPAISAPSGALNGILGQLEGLGALSPQQMTSQSNDLLKKQEAVTDKAETAIRANDQSTRNIVNNPLPKPALPQLQNIPQAPQQEYRDPKQVFKDSGTVLAVLGSLLTRHPLTTALNAGAAAMNAFHAGDQQRLELEHKNWESALESALRQNQTEMDRYNAAVNDRQMSVSDRMAEIEANAAASKDEQMIAAMHSGNLSAALDLLNARQTAAQQLYGILQRSQEMGMQAERLQLEKEKLHFMETGGGPGGGGLDSQTTDMIAQQYLKTGQMPALGYGPQGAAARRQVLTRAAQMAGGTGGDIASNKAEYGAQSKSLNQLQNYVNRVDASQNTFLKNVDQVTKYSEAGIAGETPVINKWIQAGRRATGDADVAAFDAAIKTAAREYARIMSGPTSNAQLTVSAQANADEMLSSAMNADQLQAVITVMKQDIENSKEAAQEQLDQIRGSISGIGGNSNGGSSPTPPASPAVREGQIMDGYIFNGGDPSDANNWEPVQ